MREAAPTTLRRSHGPLASRGATSTPSTTHRARYALGAVVVSLLVALLAGALPITPGAAADDTRELIRVSFRPAATRALSGWRADHGEPFDSRRAYGWVRDNGTGEPTSMAEHATSLSRSRRPSRTRTFITMQPPKQVWGRWVMSVDPGTYRVTATVGDASGAAGVQHLAVENETIIDGFKPSSAKPTKTGTVDVKVNDGLLTLDPLYPKKGTKTKLVSVKVSVVLDNDEPPTTKPPTTTPPTTNPPTTAPPTTSPPTTAPPTTQPPSGLRTQTGFAGGGLFMSYSEADMKRELDGMEAAGSTWLRIGFLWSAIEHKEGTYNYEKFDKVVRMANERGIRIVANVSYTPTWARPAGCNDMMCPPTNMDLYARFMGNLVRHYSPMGVKHYEVWNEPNQHFWWKPKPSPARYAEMLKKAFVQGHRADPGVTIMAGAFAPARDNEDSTTLNPRTFLTGMYRAGASGHFDALSFHPYSGKTDPAIVAYWNLMTGVGPDLVDIMAANGDAGTKIWATEMSYSTGNHAKSVTEAEQADLLVRAIRVWQSQPYAGPLFLFNYRDMGTNPAAIGENYGVVKRDFTPKQALRAVTAELTR